MVKVTQRVTLRLDGFGLTTLRDVWERLNFPFKEETLKKNQRLFNDTSSEDGILTGYFGPGDHQPWAATITLQRPRNTIDTVAQDFENKGVRVTIIREM